jgi:hypothetical protein
MSWEVDELEACDFSLDEELNNKSDDVSDAALLKQLCFPYSTAEPQLSESELLRIDTMAEAISSRSGIMPVSGPCIDS